MDIKNNKKNIVTILSLFLIVLTLIAGTFAYIKWSSGNDGSKVIFYTGDGFTCSADGGGDLSELELGMWDEFPNEVFMPISSCLNEEYVYKRAITVTPEIFKSDLAIQMNLWLEISELSSSFVNNSNLKYVVTTSGDNCKSGTTIASGDFGEVGLGGKIDLLKNKVYSGEGAFEETYYLYIWLDAAETNLDTSNSEISFLIDGECSKYVSSTIGAPVLDPGMIPVTIDNDGTVNVVSEYDSSWYNYDKKKWANVVLVNTDSRSNYLNKSGVTVDPDDILAYYVWIPRYKYKLFTDPPVASSDVNTPTLIDIVFESKYDDYSYGENVGEYRTHPAFWWDTNDNGDIDIDLANNETEMLSGIWVGKFETSYSQSMYKVIPDAVSDTGESVDLQFFASLGFSGDDNDYGLSSSTDSHMMKNSEWGVVTYLAHSNYGIGNEVYINNSLNNITGRSGGNVGGSVDPNDYGTYTWLGQTVSSNGVIGSITDSTLGTNASTTGNVYGVYDMSGGAAEAVMAALGYRNEDTDEIEHFSGLSGFNGFDADNVCFVEEPDCEYEETTDGISWPESRYYDLYLDDFSSCTLATCGGHALYETFRWNGDFGQFANEMDSWIARGYYYYPEFSEFNEDEGATGRYYGLFNFSNHNGSGMEENFDYAWRSVLVTG